MDLLILEELWEPIFETEKAIWRDMWESLFRFSTKQSHQNPIAPCRLQIWSFLRWSKLRAKNVLGAIFAVEIPSTLRISKIRAFARAKVALSRGEYSSSVFTHLRRCAEIMWSERAKTGEEWADGWSPQHFPKIIVSSIFGIPWEWVKRFLVFWKSALS